VTAMYEGADGVTYLNATKNFHVTEVIRSEDSVAVSAAAGTGWRYIVVVTKLPRPIAGGEFVVTVLSPWTAAYPLGDAYGVHADKVLERFVPEGYGSPQNVAAITSTINYALGDMRVRHHPAEETS
jgi:hypothetical protein